MKKLALALVCLVTVAFFTSCGGDKDLNPTIALVAEDGYISQDCTVESGTPLMVGFDAAANVNSNTNLTSFEIKIASGDNVLYDTTYTMDQATYEYVNSFTIEGTGVVSITGIITDADGYTASAVLNITLTDQSLLESAVEWTRVGGNAGTGLANFGLEWTSNYKEVFATIKPVTGATLYQFNSNVWSQVTTQSAKIAAFENATAIENYRGVSCNAGATYDDVIGTVYNGNYYLIHITSATVTAATSGTTIVIKGASK